jgi:hypothetical protein
VSKVLIDTLDTGHDTQTRRDSTRFPVPKPAPTLLQNTDDLETPFGENHLLHSNLLTKT